MDLAQVYDELGNLVDKLKSNYAGDKDILALAKRLRLQLDSVKKQDVDLEFIGNIEKSNTATSDTDNESGLEKQAQQLAKEEGISKASAYDRLLAEDAEKYNEYLASQDWSTRAR